VRCRPEANGVVERWVVGLAESSSSVVEPKWVVPSAPCDACDVAVGDASFADVEADVEGAIAVVRR
jgi:hypothetical protein